MIRPDDQEDGPEEAGPEDAGPENEGPENEGNDAGETGGEAGGEADDGNDGGNDGAAAGAAAGGPALRLRRPVVLIGLMGAGKTSVGRRLAARLRAPFVDSDEEVVKAARMSVPEIFERMGEAGFRDGERRVIARLLERGPRVIATGGGAWMTPLTRQAIRERGAAVVWLRAELDTLLERVGRKGGRPLLARGDPREILAGLMEARHPVYAEADLVVDSRAGDRHEAVMNRILAALKARGDVIEGPRGPEEDA